MIDCSGGQITVAGQVIHDDKSDRGLGTIPVAAALAQSSDVCAIKLALRVGPDKMYQYIRSFGFGSRSSVELPGETRGLLRPLKNWRPASIGYVAIGQEVAVTPLQLVSMVSTIADGGVYLPPHILMQDQTANQAPMPPLVASPVKAGEDLPSQLPPGAHRVISTLAAAEMRKMMEGVVLFGTGKSAQLDGYSSGGKTGTAQKIDPVTHTYSKTMHIASFAGFAPVEQSRHRRGHRSRLAQRRLLRCLRLRAGLRRGGAAGPRIPGCAARHRPSPGRPSLKERRAHHRRRCSGARGKH